ncbi:MAG: transcriptional regulator GcvA, partial [Kiloniellales bacterium]|nr:transcriptional regulator GcvA [Kiloniellales bacterium]
MARPLPPLTALRAFESAGRHLSFTKAAAELNVTPAAVSHQVKALEELLEVPLFRRRTRALRLTDAGQAALPTLSQGFDKLAQGVEQMRAHCESGVLTISVSPSFGAMWLVPRLERFRVRHPDIEIRIDGTDRRVDLTRGEADVALRYGPGGYNGVRVDWLFSQLNTPVCSPALLRGEHPLRQPDDLRHHTLLHIDWKDAEASWRMWLLAAGLHDIDPTRGPRFTMETMAVQAALDGQGVALIGDMLVADDLASGRLVRPFDPSLSTPLTFSYYLL